MLSYRQADIVGFWLANESRDSRETLIRPDGLDEKHALYVTLAGGHSGYLNMVLLGAGDRAPVARPPLDFPSCSNL